jgi:dTDP-4-dehydrorhamnose reductase
MQALAAEKPEVRVVSDRFGSPTYAPHLAAAITFLITTGAYGTYHLAGRGGTSWYEFTRVLFQTVKLLVPVIPIATADFPRAAERPRYAVLTTLQDPLILLPPWQDGVQEYVNTLNT